MKIYLKIGLIGQNSTPIICTDEQVEKRRKKTPDIVGKRNDVQNRELVVPKNHTRSTPGQPGDERDKNQIPGGVQVALQKATKTPVSRGSRCLQKGNKPKFPGGNDAPAKYARGGGKLSARLQNSRPWLQTSCSWNKAEIWEN